MYILPVSRSFYKNIFDDSAPQLPLQQRQCAKEILRLLNSGCSEVSPCVDEYKKLAVLGFHPPMDGKIKNDFQAFLGPEKALRALQNDIRQGRKITEELLIDIFQL